MEPVVWTSDGWWRTKNGRVPSNTPQIAPDNPQVKYHLADSDEFDSTSLALQWFFHLRPDYSGSYWTLRERPGWLRIKTHAGDFMNNETQRNVFLQRVTNKKFEIMTRLEFDALRYISVTIAKLMQPRV
jgi:beta-xylosidase